eukprot:GFYU01004142.1.p1 GENE.GFYU01004142.1~~GFYU01004142.1.p1  ORF type:complete len:122 (+),score=28.46 GFYU01004142.1:148-513(+)
MNKLQQDGKLESRVCTMHNNCYNSIRVLATSDEEESVPEYERMKAILEAKVKAVCPDVACGLVVQNGFRVLYESPADVTVCFLLDNIAIDSKEISFVPVQNPSKEDIFKALYRADATGTAE